MPEPVNRIVKQQRKPVPIVMRELTDAISSTNTDAQTIKDNLIIIKATLVAMALAQGVSEEDIRQHIDSFPA